MTTKPPVKVRFYRLRNRLKDKLGGAGGGALTLSPDALSKAQAAFEKMAEDYPDWVQRHIEQLRLLHARCVDSPQHRAKHCADLRELAHDMKGQGGTFGFPLITAFAASLYEFANPRAAMSDAQVEIVKAHIDAMAAVIKGRVKGHGGQVGLELSENLNRAISKYETST